MVKSLRQGKKNTNLWNFGQECLGVLAAPSLLILNSAKYLSDHMFKQILRNAHHDFTRAGRGKASSSLQGQINAILLQLWSPTRSGQIGLSTQELIKVGSTRIWCLFRTLVCITFLHVGRKLQSCLKPPAIYTFSSIL